MCGRIEALAREYIEAKRPDLVLVQGDTNSALGAARAARSCGVALGHVEAGLRTFDPADPWPEERNRVEIDRIADLLFAPTPAACRNLEAERVRGAVLMTGNTAIDALLHVASTLERPPLADPVPTILVTVHRRENRGRGILAVAQALRAIARQEPVRFVVPLHPNPAARAEMVTATDSLAAVRHVEPQAYRDMVGLMMRSRLVLTDSGGLQEEGPALGRPVLILRASTERPEAIASGNAMLVGIDPDRIATETLRLLRDDEAHARMSVPAFPFGKGGAGDAIAAAVDDFLRGETTARIPNLSAA